MRPDFLLVGEKKLSLREELKSETVSFVGTRQSYFVIRCLGKGEGDSLDLNH